MITEIRSMDGLIIDRVVLSLQEYAEIIYRYRYQPVRKLAVKLHTGVVARQSLTKKRRNHILKTIVKHVTDV